MQYTDYLGFEIVSDPDYFDMFAVRGKTIRDYKPVESRFRFKTVEDAKIFIDGWLSGFGAKNPILNINVWKDKSDEDYSSKVLWSDDAKGLKED
jgi:hypothetical protein